MEENELIPNRCDKKCLMFILVSVFCFCFYFQILTVCALLLQFTALAQQTQIMKNHDDQVGNNLFSFVIIMGIVVCFFKLLSDCMLIYGAKHVSHPKQSGLKFQTIF